MINVDVVIPCYNEKKDKITKTVQAITNQSKNVNNIFIVDDGSHTKIGIKKGIKNGTNIEVIEHGTNMGISIARNTGLNKSKSDFIAFIDVEVVIPERWIEECIKYITSVDNVAAVCSRIRKNDPNILDIWRNRFLEPSYEHEYGSYAVPACTGHAVLFKTNLVKALGGYDSRYSGHFDDADICIRLRKKGYEVHVIENRCFDYIEENTINLLAKKVLRNSGWDINNKYPENPTLKPVHTPYTELNQTYWMLHRIGRNVLGRRLSLIVVDIKVWIESIRIVWGSNNL